MFLPFCYGHPDEDAVALLIDADHMPAPSIGLFQSLAERLGPLPVQWVYGNWPAGNLKPWQQALASHVVDALKSEHFLPSNVSFCPEE